MFARLKNMSFRLSKVLKGNNFELWGLNGKSVNQTIISNNGHLINNIKKKNNGHLKQWK